jgi:hypothetical protein
MHVQRGELLDEASRIAVGQQHEPEQKVRSPTEQVTKPATTEAAADRSRFLMAMLGGALVHASKLECG